MSASTPFFGVNHYPSSSIYGQLYVAIIQTEDNLERVHTALKEVRKNDISPLQKIISSPQRDSKPSIIINIPRHAETGKSLATADDIQRAILVIWKKFQEKEVEFCLWDDNLKGQRIACDCTLTPFFYKLNNNPQNTVNETISNVYLSRQKIQDAGIEMISRLELHQLRVRQLHRKSLSSSCNDQDKIVYEERLIAALKTEVEFPLGLFDELSELWDETPGTPVDKAKALLDNYTGLHPFSSWLNSFTRHHCDAITILKGKIENKGICTLVDLLVSLKDIPLENKHGHVSAITAVILKKTLEEMDILTERKTSQLAY